MQKTKPSKPEQNFKFEAPVEFAREEASGSVSPFYGFDDEENSDEDYVPPNHHETDSTDTTQEYNLKSKPNKENDAGQNPPNDVSHTIEVPTKTSPKKRKTRSAGASVQPAAKIKLVLRTPKVERQKKTSKPAKNRNVTPIIKQTDQSDQDAVSFLIENVDANPSLAHQDEASKAVAYEKRKHECQVCGKRFYGKSNLVDHLRYHANVKPFQCLYCDKSFTQMGSLQCHLRTHTGLKPFVCQICNKAFNQSSSLKVHIRSHTQERNHVCEVCSKRFLSNSDLSKHRYTHATVKRYQCEFCNTGYAQNTNLRKHILNRHSDQLDGAKKRKNFETNISPKSRKVNDLMSRSPKSLKRAEIKAEAGPIQIMIMDNDRKQDKRVHFVNSNLNSVINSA